MIHLERGVITNELTQPLSPEESYVVNTPNAVLAVRGTFFRVEVEEQNPDEDDSPPERSGSSGGSSQSSHTHSPVMATTPATCTVAGNTMHRL